MAAKRREDKQSGRACFLKQESEWNLPVGNADSSGGKSTRRWPLKVIDQNFTEL
jgi:hypothetical protein